MKPSTHLIQFIQERNLPWISHNPELDRFEFVIDNHLLSTYRSCPQHFMRLAVDGWQPRGEKRIWFLDFGTLFHRLMEEYYAMYKSENFSLEAFAITRALAHWKDMEMDYHLAEKECQEMGGYPGFAALLLQYALRFKAENEALDIIASEVSFGKNKDVPIYIWGGASSDSEPIFSYADIYLAGRIDIIGDDGNSIIPMDHKTKGNFYKPPLDDYLNDDGPAGYIYAINKMLPKLFPSLSRKRRCDKILMNMVSKRIPKEGPRILRSPIWKGEAALEAYRLRQIATCNNILSDLELHSRGLSVQRDSSKCNNWYYKKCKYFDVCRQQDRAGEQNTLQSAFIQLPIWDTESIQPLYQLEAEGA